MERSAGDATTDEEPVATCSVQGGTLSVYEDRVTIERSKRSLFEDVEVPMAEIGDVGYARGIVTGHLQVRRDGADLDDGGLFTHPVDAYTLHFPRGEREHAAAVRDAILERAGGG